MARYADLGPTENSRGITSIRPIFHRFPAVDRRYIKVFLRAENGILEARRRLFQGFTSVEDLILRKILANIQKWL
jgi:hypothetical protein